MSKALKNSFITLTGVDEKTNYGAFADHLQDTETEVGFLYSANPDRIGTPRYPSLEFIREAASAFAHTAVHICGRAAREAFIASRLDGIINEVDRVQINGAITNVQLAEIAHIMRTFDKPTIIQFDQSKEHLLMTKHHFDLLHDGSGGQGLLPQTWNYRWKDASAEYVCRPLRFEGFAGGLNMGNLKEELPKIFAAAKGRAFWIDIETGCRDHADQFSISNAIGCHHIFWDFIKAKIAEETSKKGAL